MSNHGFTQTKSTEVFIATVVCVLTDEDCKSVMKNKRIDYERWVNTF